MPPAQTFGSNISTSNWEPIAKVRVILAKLFQDILNLVAKHKQCLQLVKYPPKSTKKI